MNQFEAFNTSFILDKAHFSECYDQSVNNKGLSEYKRAAVLALIGCVLVFAVDVSKYLAFFIVALAAVEALSVYYKKTWWLWRQMISKAYDHEVELSIDQDKIITKSFHVNNELAWPDVTTIVETDIGFLLHHSSGVNYLSKGYLSDQAIEFIHAQS